MNDDSSEDECQSDWNSKAMSASTSSSTNSTRGSSTSPAATSQRGHTSGTRGRASSTRGRARRTRGRAGCRGRRATSKGKSSNRNTTPEFSWSSTTLTHNKNTDQVFTEVPGPRRIPPSVKEPVDYFLLFFNLNLVSHIVAQTNLYYRQNLAANANLASFTDVCDEELLAYFGVIIAMGMYKLPKLSDYWKTTGIGAMPWFRSVFSKNRFLAISKYLHINDNTKRPEQGQLGHKLFHVQPVIDWLVRAFQSQYTPSQQLSVDEQMVGTRCRISFLQYMPKKPKKFGIKIWTLCEAKTGYCCNFQIYTGKSESEQECGLAYRVVFDLLQPFLNKWYQVFFDNFFSSTKLVADLEKQNTLACGTLRSNRKNLPSDLTEGKYCRGQVKFWICGNLSVVRWKDKRDVYAISSWHPSIMVTIPPRKDENEEVQKPAMIQEYNQFMGGVDLCDQLLNYYALSRKSKKWWKRVFYRLLELCVINSLVLYKANNPNFAKKYMAHKAFRETLVVQLVQKLLDNQADPSSTVFTFQRGRPSQDELRLKGKHFQSTTKERKRCVVCGYQKSRGGKYKDTKTHTYCSKCEQHICKKCFATYHTNLVYKK